jgi:hypothetical protein
MFTTGYGIWETLNLSDLDNDGTIRWQIMSTGIEETVPQEFYSPKEGAQVLTAVLDYGGFTHFDVDKSEGYHTNPYFMSTDGLTGAENKPLAVVRVGSNSAHHPGGKSIAYSEDGGLTWKEPATIPPGQRVSAGHIAVSADANTWIWTPARMPVFYTQDKGTTWTPSEGIAPNVRVVADRVNPARFYGVDIPTGTLYQSHDGGRTFTADSILPPLPPLSPLLQESGSRGDRRGGQDRVYATPNAEGDLWIAAYDGLYHLQASNISKMEKLDKVRRIYGFGYGKEKPGSSYPALYLMGIVNGTNGIYRSDDAAKSWIRINDDNHQYGLVLQISGDPKKYGRVYVGAHGRGVLYADPLKDK